MDNNTPAPQSMGRERQSRREMSVSHNFGFSGNASGSESDEF